jgi:hypothetical protein
MKRFLQLAALVLLLVASFVEAATTSTATYYSNSHSAGSNWQSPDNADDGNVNTWAYYAAYSFSAEYTSFHQYSNNTVPTTFVGPITKVEIRFYTYGYCGGGVGAITAFKFKPLPASNLQTLWSIGPVEEKAEGWSSWVDITEDSAAPDWGVTLYQVHTKVFPYVYGYMLGNESTHLFRLHATQIRVTYIPYAPITQAF